MDLASGAMLARREGNAAQPLADQKCTDMKFRVGQRPLPRDRLQFHRVFRALHFEFVNRSSPVKPATTLLLGKAAWILVSSSVEHFSRQPALSWSTRYLPINVALLIQGGWVGASSRASHVACKQEWADQGTGKEILFPREAHWAFKTGSHGT
ncbi:hypothetical protein K493DRAFT_372419 [Basidiobolus meristosporus CBS 931.73]|uniref:Uncharacterized protein n=1 Tax=Basidiobolus meristosporus CBS 931.73 TaxID=1314790 RepID=A0A1Y1YBH7_9FUNG|nr:hypothetical protein K493DRAFT_372419 [Basidiobolus meristosporus CBS 931.73]|eukprot:ORX95293.1 hypothetical protein K493DRAFT_372419 [Basidiobolus meristosporus CBS 931.73]